MSHEVEYVPFKGRVHKLDGIELQYLKEAQVDGETLEQALERIIIEYEEEKRQERLRQRNFKPNTMDYYLTIEN